MSTQDTTSSKPLMWNFNLEKAQSKNQGTPLKDPLGFKSNTNDIIVRSSSSKTSNMTYVEVLEAKAWALAKSPAGSLMQTMFMFWISGSSVSIFTIMITMQFMTSPIFAISGVNQ